MAGSHGRRGSESSVSILWISLQPMQRCFAASSARRWRIGAGNCSTVQVAASLPATIRTPAGRTPRSNFRTACGFLPKAAASAAAVNAGAGPMDLVGDEVPTVELFLIVDLIFQDTDAIFELCKSARLFLGDRDHAIQKGSRFVRIILEEFDGLF